MAATVPAVRREPDETAIRVGFGPSSSDTWTQLAELANWLRGSGAQLVSANFPGIGVAASTTRVLHFYTKPRATAIQRIWVFYLRTTSSAVASTATIKAPASTGTAVTYTVPHGISRRLPFVYTHTLAARASTATEITFEITAAGAEIDVWGVQCYEQGRPDLVLDSTDLGVDVESERGGQPIWAVNNTAEEGIRDVALNGAHDARRTSIFHWAVPEESAVTRTANSYSSLFQLVVPVLAPLTDSGETTSYSGKVKCSVYAKVAAGSGKVRITTDGSSVSQEFTITGTSFGWATPVTIAIDVDDLTASDGRRSTRWDGLQVDLQGDGTNALSLAGVSVWVETVV